MNSFRLCLTTECLAHKRRRTNIVTGGRRPPCVVAEGHQLQAGLAKFLLVFNNCSINEYFSVFFSWKVLGISSLLTSFCDCPLNGRVVVHGSLVILIYPSTWEPPEPRSEVSSLCCTFCVVAPASLQAWPSNQRFAKTCFKVFKILSMPLLE